MSKLDKHQGGRERFAKCSFCMEVIPVEYYFSKGDTIVCYECGTEYIITSKDPVKLSVVEGYYDPDDYYSDLLYED